MYPEMRVALTQRTALKTELHFGYIAIYYTNKGASKTYIIMVGLRTCVNSFAASVFEFFLPAL